MIAVDPFPKLLDGDLSLSHLSNEESEGVLYITDISFQVKELRQMNSLGTL